MYQFSRSIYRELAPLLAESGPSGTASTASTECKLKVLDACESTMQRLLNDRGYFARPTKTLFEEIRCCFPMRDQVYVYRVVDANVRLAIRYLETTPADQLLIEGVRECRAHTRRGTPCQREPLPARDYCPSHKHLEESPSILARSAPELVAAA